MDAAVSVLSDGSATIMRLAGFNTRMLADYGLRLVGPILARRTKACHNLLDILVPVADERASELESAKRGQKATKHVRCSGRWTT